MLRKVAHLGTAAAAAASTPAMVASPQIRSISATVVAKPPTQDITHHAPAAPTPPDSVRPNGPLGFASRAVRRTESEE